MKPQTVQIVRQGEATPYWFKVNPLYFHNKLHATINCLGNYRNANQVIPIPPFMCRLSSLYFF